MGYCKDCVYYSDNATGLLSRHYCRLFSNEKYFFVSETGSCDHFLEKATPKNSGYNRGGGCFLTSACVEYLGKADDCEELTVLRAFRDGYMKSVDGGEKLIKDYYAIAPKIVENINTSEHKGKYYTYINETVDKCVKLIELKENERALTEYKFMVENLKKEFCI